MNNKSLFFGMELSDKKTLLITDDRISTLGKLHEALTHAWSRETAFPACKGDWSPSNPALGQCTITAMIVHDLFGGTIHRVRLAGGGTHYFNRIDGVYVDLTSSQFADYANECPLEPNEERGREHCGRTPDTWNRYRLLIDNINAWILSESDDGRITPLMPSGTAPEPYRKGHRAYEEVAGGYATPTRKNGYSKPYNKGNEKTSAKYSKYGKDGNAKIRRAMGVCPECGGALVRRSGKYGDFLGCTHYPECHFTVPLEKAEFSTDKSIETENNTSSAINNGKNAEILTQETENPATVNSSVKENTEGNYGSGKSAKIYGKKGYEKQKEAVKKAE